MTAEAIRVLQRAGFQVEVIDERKEAMGELSSPRQGDIVKPSDVVGHLLIVRPVEFLPEFLTSNGARDTVRVDVADLNANTDDGQWGVVFRDALWFGRVLVAGLRRQMGELVLGWMTQGIGKPGQNPPFLLTDAMGNADAVRVAQQWLNQHPEFEATTSTVAPSSAPPAQQAQAPLPLPGGAPQQQAPVPAQYPPTAAPAPQGVPAPPAPPAAPQPAGSATLPIPGGAQPAVVNAQMPNAQSALANLSAEQKAALAALGYPVG